MVSHGDYVAGWLDSSIRDFFEVFPPRFGNMKYALVTCLDSELEPAALLKRSEVLRSAAGTVRPLGGGVLLPTKDLLRHDAYREVFFGFDEIWFFPDEINQSKPDSAWLVGPGRTTQTKLDKLGTWMSSNSCTLALGDGAGLNFIVKARGLVKYLLGHSLNQRQTDARFPPTESEIQLTHTVSAH